ncbi:MAG: HTH-type transcriptional regulator Xre [Firmicutes bacterium ADurb.Bin193]|nr:MAG: HTH-type transcriptional regulator Xre [Firmicutes bacterium ADurb.Bin193]
MVSFGTRLRALRRENFLTQDELAKELEKLGCFATTKCAISQYENGKRFPDVKALRIIADFFKVSTDYILGNDDCEEEQKMLSLFRRLDEKGKQMTIAYATALYDSANR